MNRLPPEIISYVSRFVLGDFGIDARLIIPLTHVCRYWRDSIISTPENWALISNERESLATLSLERAKEAPLTIHLGMSKLETSKHPRFLKLLFSHIQNTRSLSVHGLYTIKELIRALPNFPKSMPNLQSLTLTSHGQTEWTLPADPFDFSAHTLRNLSLYNTPLCHSFLSPGTLKELTLVDHFFDLHLGTFADFLGESHSLESASLDIKFAKASLRLSRPQTPIENRLRHLSIRCRDMMDCQALISSMTLRRGAALEIEYNGGGMGLADILSGVSTTCLPSLSSSIFMEYRPSQGIFRLLGPCGSFSLHYFRLGESSQEFLSFPLDTIRELHLEYLKFGAGWITTEIRLSSFPSLEVLGVIGGTSISQVLSTLSSNASPCPSLKTLAFLNCVITEGFMNELAQFAFDREKTTSTSLHRVVIVGSGEGFPSGASIERLRKRVPVVEVIEGHILPIDLREGGLTV